MPSSGGLQALEVYLVNLEEGWLPRGLYHYDRGGHHLSQIAEGADRKKWEFLMPSLCLIQGGSVLWVLVGDGERIANKYGERACRFMLLEAGHLMQNLCLVSWSLGMSTVALGGVLEREVAEEFMLLPTDEVLYAGVCGKRI